MPSKGRHQRPETNRNEGKDTKKAMAILLAAVLALACTACGGSKNGETKDRLVQIKEKGYTLVPLQVYFKGSLVKVEIGLARGKKLYDKRQDIAKKDQRREAERDFKVKNLY